MRDLNTFAEPQGVYYGDSAVSGGSLYFPSYQPQSGMELWKSDGTPAGTVLLRDFLPGPLGSAPHAFAAAAGAVYFVADDGVAGSELWKTDGTAGGTVRVADVTPGPQGSTVANAVAV
ncbi:MAG TPA: ELWxxDGT repeat protein, partial [Tepidisphaeraceae bacterium]|nr:ELWxxDGT repeat protein [Tepidisphaeraceae bacterium]